LRYLRQRISISLEGAGEDARELPGARGEIEHGGARGQAADLDDARRVAGRPRS
jgi:hypothetical protein